ncbi:MAG: V-type ATP synthase subunit D [Thermodesulfobacteriota bacterium]
MADLLNVNPTRGTLLRLKDELKGVRTRHDLLDRKREVLIQELMSRLEKAEDLEQESRDYFQAAHQAIQKARMRMGSDRIDWISLSPTVRFDVDVSARTIMGLKIPSVEIDIQSSDTPPYGVSDTSAALDEAREKWMDVLRFLADASDIFTSVWRLAMELRKTQRQVNALESTLIPRYRNTIRHIESRLEEEEREEIVIAKKVKEMGA